MKHLIQNNKAPKSKILLIVLSCILLFSLAKCTVVDTSTLDNTESTDSKKTVVVVSKDENNKKEETTTKKEEATAKKEETTTKKEEVTTKKEEITTKKEKTVYITPTGSKYHYSKSCAGKNAIEKYLSDVKDSYGACKKCT